MTDCPDCLGAIARAALRQMQRCPFRNQRIKGERQFGALALGFPAPTHAVGLGIDPLCHRLEASPHRLVHLFDRDAAPNAKRFADLAPLRDRSIMLKPSAYAARSTSRRDRDKPYRKLGDPCGLAHL
jgi:hypothetical protein